MGFMKNWEEKGAITPSWLPSGKWGFRLYYLFILHLYYYSCTNASEEEINQNNKIKANIKSQGGLLKIFIYMKKIAG